MKVVLTIVLSIVAAALAWDGYQSGNDFLLYLCGLIAFAPLTALVAMKANLF
jgi:hypothetical protein